MAMQAKALMMLVVAISVAGTLPLTAGDWRGGGNWGGGREGGRGGPDDGGRGGHGDRPRHGGPSIYIEPNLDISRTPRSNVDTPEVMLAEIQRCDSFGVRFFVD